MPIQLDDAQSALIEIVSGQHYLQAPPGAGKTAILTARLKHALGLFDHNTITCLTFTTRAADEMKARAGSLIDFQGSDSRLFIGNFHAYCIHHLHTSKTVNKENKHFALLNDDFYQPILEQVCSMRDKEELENIPLAYLELVDNACSYINTKASQYTRRSPSISHVFKQVYIHILALDNLPTKQLQTLAVGQLERKLNDFLLVVAEKFKLTTASSGELAIASWSMYKNFRQIKSITNSLDFDDILILALSDLVKHPKLKRFIQVDEVQDLSPYQWEILNAISDQQSHIFAVGDNQQSIYGFMGADILHLKSRVEGFVHHYLENNYRSHPNIIQLLNLFRTSNWQIEPIKAVGILDDGQEPSESDVPSLLLGFKNKQSEIIGVGKAVAKILRDPNRSIGVLLSTNAQCDDYCNLLEGITGGIFRVSQNDLIQRPIVQDWFSALKILSGTESYHDWWRLVYRFGRLGEPSLTKNKTLSFCYKMQALGFSLYDILSSNKLKVSTEEVGCKALLGNANISRCMQAFTTSGVIIFDTETTGLNFENSSIIQLAAIRVVNGEVLDIFDRYVNIHLDKSEGLKNAFYESQAIHHITETDLQSGHSFEQVAQEFFDFVGDAPVIAHNLLFDLTMLRLNVSQVENPQLQMQYKAFRGNVMFDSLALSRQLYPSLASHKLGDLLERFNLPGVNSHNALDDVKATASLVKYLFDEMNTRLPALDELINQHEKLFKAFALNSTDMFNALISVAEQQPDIYLSHTLKTYIEVVQKHNLYDPASSQSNIDELNFKLIPWLDKNGYVGLFNYLLDTNRPNTEKLLTLKESDLIDKSIHRLVISTVHRAKGLEFETVILPQVTDNNYPMWIPNNVSELERTARIQESCRLLYVGLSRPKNKLIVTFHHMAGSYHRAVSPFVIGMMDAFAWINLNVDS